MSATSIEIEDGFWRLLLGSQFDKMDSSDQTIENLIDKFYSGRKPFVDAKYSSKDGLLEAIRREEKEEAQRILLTIWAEEKWERKSTGDKFEFESDLQDELDTLEEEGLYLEVLSDGFTLAWPSEEVRLALFENDGVRSQVFEEAHPLFLKREEATLEIRGSKRRVDRFSKDFTESDDVKKVERESARESIIEGLSTVFEDDIGSLELIEIDFRESNLPDGSAVALKNPDGVREDLNSEIVKPQVVDFDNLSSLNYLRFEHSKSGKAIKINVRREESGFFFEIQDSYLSEIEKENIKEILEERLEISFASIYPYDVQHDEEYVLHQILSGNIEAYKRYFEDLTEDNKDFITDYITITSDEIFECRNCQEDHEDKRPDSCNECGAQSFSQRTEQRVEVDSDSIHSDVLETFNGLENTIVVDDTITLSNVSVSEHGTKYNEFIRVTFNMSQSTGKAGDQHHFEFFLYCLGNGRVPRRINRYLLDAVMITFGKSRINTRDDFGTVNLYELSNIEDSEDSLEKLFANAVLESRSRISTRIFSQTTDAKINLKDLQRQAENGEFEELSDGETSELKDEYDSDDFERDVFYLFKAMFLFTERWGRPGKTETDGCLVIPNSDDYYVTSYDPKLTYDPRGYDLNAAEKKKAAYYILSENKNGYVQNVLKEDERTIDGHIFISDIFREGQFKYIADHVQKWFRIASSGSDAEIEVPVIFLSLKNLLQIYRIFERNYDQIEEYVNVQKGFRESFMKQLKDGTDGYSVVDEDAVESIRERILEERAKTSRQHQIETHAEDS